MSCCGKTRRLRFGAALACLLGLAAPAAAQDSQYWDIQYGLVGQLLGGQVVGSVRDLSAAYYNAGGLALGADPDFLISVQAFKKQTIPLRAERPGDQLPGDRGLRAGHR